MSDQRGFTLWFTGLSGSGKTAIAKLVERELRDRGLKVERLDGDIVRRSLTRDLGFSKEDRDRNIERVTFVAKLLTRNGVAVLCSFISPYRSRRPHGAGDAGGERGEGYRLSGGAGVHKAGVCWRSHRFGL